MSLGSFISRVVPAAIGFATGGPIGATTAIYGTEQQKSAERKIKREQERIEQQRRIAMAIGDINAPGAFPVARPENLTSGGSPGFFDRLSTFGSNFGNTLLTGFETALPGVISEKVFGVRPGTATQQPAITSTTNIGAQESQGSGSIQAGAGSLLAPVFSGLRNLLKSPGGQLAFGTGTGLALGGFGSQGTSMRITRKMKSQARMVLNMTGGNLQAAADILGIDQNMLVMILLKRFRNDGPVVTKAALRKTKQTIRRLHSMQDVLKSITPTAAGRRRAPMKRATTTTLIKN